MAYTTDAYTNSLNNNQLVSHYSDIQVIESILRNNEFWLTNIAKMNDSMEVKWFEKISNDVLSLYKKTLPSVHYSFTDLVSNIINHFENKVFSMSFSMNNDSFHCWNIYPRDNPCNIAFEYQYLSSILQNNSYTIRNIKTNSYDKINCSKLFGPVIYDYHSQLNCVQESIINILKTSRDKPDINSSECLKLFEPFVFAFYRSKYFGFEPEQEVRFAIILPQESENYIDSRDKDGCKIEYIKMKIDDKIYPKKIVFKNKNQIQDNLLTKNMPEIIQKTTIESSYLYNWCLRE